MAWDRQYRGPAVAGVVLFAASCAWAWMYWDGLRDRETDQWRRMAEGLAASLAPLMDPGACPAAADDAALGRLVEERLRIDRPLAWAVLLRDGRRVAAVGPEAPDPSDPLEPGPTPDGRRTVFRVAVGPRAPADRPPRDVHPGEERAPEGDRPPPDPERPRPDPERPRRDPAGPDRPARSPWAWDANDSRPEATLAVAVDTRIPPQVYRKNLPQILFALLVGWSGIAALVLAWHRSIRSRDLARRLDAEQRERARLEEMNLAAAGLAHETKNPLGIILGLAQRITADAQVAPGTREAAQHIIDAADQAAARVSDFLGFARIPRPRLEAVAADELLGRVAAALRPDFADAGIALEVQVPSVRLVCTPAMLEQVLMNLLLNSLQASARGTAVTLRLEPRGATAALVVEDQGRGIPAALLPEVFKPYVTSRAEGHGLGLAIVKRIVDQHGWTVDVDSVEGRGTRVTVARIPLSGATGRTPA